MIGAADPLDQPAGPFRCADVDDEVHIAPVDAQIERRGRHHRLERAGRHRRLDLAAAGGIERAMMQRDRQAVLVHPPQFLEQQLGLAAGVHENQRQIVGLDGGVDFRNGIARAVPGPGQRRLRIQHADVVRRAAVDRDEIRKPHRAAARLRHQIRAQLARLGDGGRQPDPHLPRRQGGKPRQVERQQIAALGRRQRVQFVEDDRVEIAEQLRGIGMRQQQRHLLRRRQQHIGRPLALARLAAHRRVAAARLDADRQRHLLHGQQQIAGDIGSQRLERRDIERMHARTAAALAPATGRPGWAGSRPASCPSRSGRSAASSCGSTPGSSSLSWCSRGCQPRAANQRRNTGGSTAAGTSTRSAAPGSTRRSKLALVLPLMLLVEGFGLLRLRRLC